MTDRTKDQEFADKLDCDLFRLVMRAEREGRRDKHWLKVATELKAVRSSICMRMHSKDKEQTI